MLLYVSWALKPIIFKYGWKLVIIVIAQNVKYLQSWAVGPVINGQFGASGGPGIEPPPSGGGIGGPAIKPCGGSGGLGIKPCGGEIGVLGIKLCGGRIGGPDIKPCGGGSGGPGIELVSSGGDEEQTGGWLFEVGNWSSMGSWLGDGSTSCKLNISSKIVAVESTFLDIPAFWILSLIVTISSVCDDCEEKVLRAFATFSGRISSKLFKDFLQFEQNPDETFSKLKVVVSRFGAGVFNALKLSSPSHL